MKVGVLGGTFDPVHIGHLIIAEEVRCKLELAEVLFAPTGQPWLKSHRSITPAADRLEMLRRALQSNPYFRISTVDIDRAGPTYSVDTIADLQNELGAETLLYFILGLDALAELPTWREPARLMEMCQIVGVTRPGYGEFDLSPFEPAIPQASRHIILLEVPQIGISSSEIRARVAQGLPIRYQVPEPVEEYIRERGLYLP
jgi:nicotinate-nucleotide adenylyltransferase